MCVISIKKKGKTEVRRRNQSINFNVPYSQIFPELLPSSLRNLGLASKKMECGEADANPKIRPAGCKDAGGLRSGEEKASTALLHTPFFSKDTSNLEFRIQSILLNQHRGLNPFSYPL